MHRNRTRLTVIAGTTMALAIAATAAVSAAGPRDRGWGPGDAGFGGRMGEGTMPGARGLGAFRGLGADVERREVTVQTADGTTASRVEQGTLDTADEASLSFSLGSGEAVMVVIDDDTEVIGFEEQVVTRGGWSRTRLAATEIEIGEIEAGDAIVVWSDSEDEAGFVASRVVVMPADDAAAEEAEGTAPEATEEATNEDATEDAVTDA